MIAARLKNLTALLACAGAAGCTAQPAPPFSSGFLAHLRANAPDPVKDCVVARTLARWPSERALYAAAGAVRVTRGETDVVNFAIGQVAASCSVG